MGRSCDENLYQGWQAICGVLGEVRGKAHNLTFSFLLHFSIVWYMALRVEKNPAQASPLNELTCWLQWTPIYLQNTIHSSRSSSVLPFDKLLSRTSIMEQISESQKPNNGPKRTRLTSFLRTPLSTLSIHCWTVVKNRVRTSDWWRVARENFSADESVKILISWSANDHKPPQAVMKGVKALSSWEVCTSAMSSKMASICVTLRSARLLRAWRRTASVYLQT